MVKTKAEFLALSSAGRLGNFLRSWRTLRDVERSGYNGFLTIRSRVPGSKHFIPVTSINRRRAALRGHLSALKKLGAHESDLYFQQIPDPCARRVIQFEAIRDEHYVTIYYELDTTAPLRGICARGICARGVAAVSILRAHLSPASLDDLWAIWDEHPASVIEATEFSRPVGEYGRRLLFWEVRDF